MEQSDTCRQHAYLGEFLMCVKHQLNAEDSKLSMNHPDKDASFIDITPKLQVPKRQTK
jgi:hypothetical protein